MFKLFLCACSILVLSNCSLASESLTDTAKVGAARALNIITYESSAVGVTARAGHGLGYERALGRWISGKIRFEALTDLGNITFPGRGEVSEQGLDLGLATFPFGAAPGGLFIGAHGRIFQRNLFPLTSKAIRYGLLGGYNLILFRHLTLGYQISFDHEQVLYDGAINNNILLISPPESSAYNWLSLGYAF